MCIRGSGSGDLRRYLAEEVFGIFSLSLPIFVSRWTRAATELVEAGGAGIRVLLV